MFRNACKVVQPFTLPLIWCAKRLDGVCSAALGTFIVVNREGWVITAGHIAQQYGEMLKDVEFIKDYRNQADQIKADPTIDDKERKKKINRLQKPRNKQIERIAQVWSIFPGNPVPRSLMAFMPVDIAVGKLEPFDPSWVASYPVFKDPTKDFDTGTSLCRTGFPFHTDIVPKWDDATQRFDLPPGTFPAPLFPIEGVFTRTIQHTPTPGSEPFPFPFRWIETSSPGLKGQSGGPIFDGNGTIWGMQCQTYCYDLDFKTATGTPQYLNVGVGVHPETLFAVFKKFDIKYDVSAY